MQEPAWPERPFPSRQAGDGSPGTALASSAAFAEEPCGRLTPNAFSDVLIFFSSCFH